MVVQCHNGCSSWLLYSEKVESEECEVGVDATSRSPRIWSSNVSGKWRCQPLEAFHRSGLFKRSPILSGLPDLHAPYGAKRGIFCGSMVLVPRSIDAFRFHLR
jgi:hypothetical protein